MIKFIKMHRSVLLAYWPIRNVTCCTSRDRETEIMLKLHWFAVFIVDFYAVVGQFVAQQIHN